jgi:hypothetical protein
MPEGDGANPGRIEGISRKIILLENKYRNKDLDSCTLPQSEGSYKRSALSRSRRLSRPES